jgi:hypothetical protein
MWTVLGRVAGLFTGEARPKRIRRRKQRVEAPALRVRALEERRVFHGGAMVAPAAAGATAPAPPPAAPTTAPLAPTLVTLDASHNLIVRDTSAGGQNDNLTIRFDAARGGFQISDPDHLVATDIAGASGSGSHLVFVPGALVSGNQFFVQTGAGDDRLTVDLSGGAGGKSLVFAGGGGQNQLTLTGGSATSIGYMISADGATTIQATGAGSFQVQALGAVQIVDQLGAQAREFSLGVNVTSATLADDGTANNGLSQFTTSPGTSITFAAPASSLAIHELDPSLASSLTWQGIDAAFHGNLSLDAGAGGQLDISGNAAIGGGSLSGRAGEIVVSGTLTTHEATVDLAAQSSLIVSASGVVQDSGGFVRLDAGENGTLQVLGRINVSSTASTASAGQGGTVQLLGQTVKLLDGAAIDANGSAGGGTVLVGGSLHGQDPLVRRATNTLVAAMASIEASATQSGNGGTIIVWADGAAIVAGSGNLHARGAGTGNGGFIETSGKRYLYVDAAPDAASAGGKAGMWLLDPYDLTIANGGTGSVDASGNFTSDATTSTIKPSTIESALLTSDVTITTGSGGTEAGNLTVKNAIAPVLGALTRTLTLNAANNIDVLASITCLTGSLNVQLNANTGGLGGHVTAAANITTNGGLLESNGSAFDNTGGVISTSGGNITLTQSGAVTIGDDLNAGSGNVTISGSSVTLVAATISGNSAAINSSGAITGGNQISDIAVSGAGAVISLSGASLGTAANPLALSLGSGNAILTAASGGVYASFDASIATSQLTTSVAGAGQSLRLATTSGDITVDSTAGFNVNTADDNLSLTAANGIAFSGGTLTAASVTLDAATTISHSGGATIDIDTSAAGGAISLTAPTQIGSAADAISVNAGSGVVSADSAAGSIYLHSPAALTLGQITTGAGQQTISISAGGDLSITASSTTDDDWQLASGGNLALVGNVTLTAAMFSSVVAAGSITGGTATSDFVATSGTPALSLSGASLGTAANPLALSVGARAVSLSAATGGIYAQFDAALSTSQMTLSAAGSGQTISLATTSGSVTINNTASFDANTDNDDLTLTSAGGIVFSGGTLTAASLTLNAATTISRTGAAAVDLDTSAASGVISLTAPGGIGSAADALRIQAGSGSVTASTSSGSIYLQSPAALTLGQITTGAGQQTVSVSAGGDLSITASSTTDDDWQLDSGGNLALVGNVTLTAAKFSSVQATGSITGGTGANDFVATGSAPAISLSASSLGTAANPLALSVGSGTVGLTAASGGIYAQFDAALSTSQLTLNAAGVGQAIGLATTTGAITVNNTTGFNANTADDDLTLQTTGAASDVAFTGGTTLTNHSITLSATGDITTDSTTPIADTSAANGAISLNGANLGSAVNPLRINPGTGNLQLTATSGDMFVRLATGDLLTSRIATLSAAKNGATISLGADSGAVTLDQTSQFNANTPNDAFIFTAGGGDLTLAAAAPLVAASATLTASGNIVATVSGTQLDTSASSGLIQLTGQAIGSVANPVAIDPGAGPVRIVASAGDAALTFAGSLATSQIQQLDVAQAGATVKLQVTSGSITFDSTAGFAANTADDNFLIGSSGGVAFSGGTLTAASVTISTTGAIARSGAATTDIDTSLAGGDVSLAASGGIGSAADPLRVNAGTGTLAASSTSGSIFVTSPANLKLGPITTGLGQQTVSIQAGGDLVVVASSTTDDDWQLVAAGNIQLSGNVTLTAGVFSNIQAGDNVASGTAAVDFQQTGLLSTLVIHAGSIGSVANPVVVDPGLTGVLDLAGSTGDLSVALANGDFTSSRLAGGTFVAPASGATIQLIAENGSINVDGITGLATNFTGDSIRLEAHGLTGNVALGNTAIVAANVSIVADGVISTSSGGTAIDTHAANGAITLQSSGPIGSPLLALVISSGTGVVSVTTTGAAGDIFLTSVGDLDVGNIDAQGPGTQVIQLTSGGAMSLAAAWDSNDLLTLSAQNDITFGPAARITAASVTLFSTTGSIQGSGSGSADIDTSAANGPISLTAASIGQSGVPLVIHPGQGSLALSSSGDVYLAVSSGDLSFSQFTTLNQSGTGTTFSLAIQSGSLMIDKGFVSLADDDLVLSAAGPAGNITVAPTTQLAGRSLTLTATGFIHGGGNSPDLLTTTGPIILSADGGIGTAATPLSIETGATGYVRATTATGDIYLRSPAALQLDKVTTGAGAQAVHIDAAGAIRLVASSTGDDVWNVTTSAGGLVFGGNSAITAASFTAALAGTIQSGTAAVDIDTSAASGAVLVTATSIGQAANPLVVAVGTGDLSLKATTGAITALAAGGNLRGSQIKNLQAVAVGANVSLATQAGSLVLDDVSHFQVADDLLTLTSGGAAGDIDFAGSGGALQAASATLSAGRSIASSGSAAVDLDTSAANGPIQLTAGVGIGTAAQPLLVLAGSGTLSATAGTGDIYIASPGPLNVVQALASGANKDISFTTTGPLSPLNVTIASLADDRWHLRASGDVTLKVADPAGIAFGQFAELGSTTAGRSVLIDAKGGPIIVDTVAPGVATAANNLSLLAEGGDVSFQPGTVLRGANVTIRSLTGSILASDDLPHVQVAGGGVLQLAAAGTIGTAAVPLGLDTPNLVANSGGSQWLVTTGVTRLQLAATTLPGANVTLTKGTFYLAPPPAQPPGSPSVVTTTLVIGDGATLGGSGRAVSSLHVLQGGTVSMGYGSDEAGNLVVSRDAIFDPGSTLVMDLNSPYKTPGTDNDHLAVGGNLALNSPRLELRGAQQLQTTLNPIVLLEMTTPGLKPTGGFLVGTGSLVQDGTFIRANVGQFRGKLFYNGGDGNDIVLSELSLVPAMGRSAPPPRPLPVPIVTRNERLPMLVQPPPVQPQATPPRPFEAQSTPIGARYLEVRIVIPTDETGGAREEFAMKLPGEWLSNLPAILRRLPDDRYRIYLLLEGGNEERLVIDVLVRDGRPVEPGDTMPGGATSTAAEPLNGPPSPISQPPVSQPPVSQPPVSQPPVSQPLPLPPPEIVPTPLPRRAALPDDVAPDYLSRVGLTAGAAVAAVIASRQPGRREAASIAAVAQAIGQRKPSVGWRWWRLLSGGSSEAKS